MKGFEARVDSTFIVSKWFLYATNKTCLTPKPSNRFFAVSRETGDFTEPYRDIGEFQSSPSMTERLNGNDAECHQTSRFDQDTVVACEDASGLMLEVS